MKIKTFLKSVLVAAFVAAAGCCSIEKCTAVAPENIGVCSWSWRLPMKDVAAAMAKSDVKG